MSAQRRVHPAVKLSFANNFEPSLYGTELRWIGRTIFAAGGRQSVVWERSRRGRAAPVLRVV